MKKSFQSLRTLYTSRSEFIKQSQSMTFGLVFYRFWTISLIALTIRGVIALVGFMIVSANVSKEQVISQSQLVMNNIAGALPSDYVLQYQEAKGFSSNQSGPVHLTYSQIFSGVIQNDANQRDDEEVGISKYSYMITIDTNPGVSITDLAKESLISITATQGAINQSRRGETRVFDIIGASDVYSDQMNNQTTGLILTPQKISQERSPAAGAFIDTNRSTFRSRVYVVAIIGGILGILIGSLAIALFTSVLMSLYALIIYFIGMMSRQNRSYRTSYGMISIAYFVPFVLFWIVGVQGIMALVIALVARAIVMFAKPSHK